MRIVFGIYDQDKDYEITVKVNGRNQRVTITENPDHDHFWRMMEQSKYRALHGYFDMERDILYVWEGVLHKDVGPRLPIDMKKAFPLYLHDRGICFSPSYKGIYREYEEFINKNRFSPEADKYFKALDDLEEALCKTHLGELYSRTHLNIDFDEWQNIWHQVYGNFYERELGKKPKKWIKYEP